MFELDRERNPHPPDGARRRSVSEIRARGIEIGKNPPLSGGVNVGNKAFAIAADNFASGTACRRTGELVAYALLRIAVRTGAVAVQIHLNMDHRRSGRVYPVADRIGVSIRIVDTAGFDGCGSRSPGTGVLQISDDDVQSTAPVLHGRRFRLLRKCLIELRPVKAVEPYDNCRSEQQRNQLFEQSRPALIQPVVHQLSLA